MRLTALAVAAGCLDAASFLGLEQVFTANQTGNTVLLGIALGQGDWEAVGRTGMSVGAFCAGVLIAALVLRGREKGWSRAITVLTAAEALLLAVLAALWGDAATVVLIALASVAMGIQSAAALRVGVPGVATTFVTGTLTTVVSGLVSRPRSERREATPAAVWIAYLAGAVAGGAATREWSGTAAIVVTAAIVAAVALSAARVGAPRSRPRR